MEDHNKKTLPHMMAVYSNIPNTFFPNVELPGRILELTVNVVVSGARLKDLAAYLTFLDRAYGRMSSYGLRTYSRRPKEQLKVAEVRPGSLEFIIEKILEASANAIPLIYLYLFLKYFPNIVKTASEGYLNYEDARLSRTKRKEIEKRGASSGQRFAKDDAPKGESQIQIKKVVDDIILKEPNLKNASGETREEITEVLGEVTKYDRQLQRGAERFSVEYVKEIRIRLVPPSDGGIKSYQRHKQTIKKDEKEEEKEEERQEEKEKVKQYVLIRN